MCVCMLKIHSKMIKLHEYCTRYLLSLSLLSLSLINELKFLHSNRSGFLPTYRMFYNFVPYSGNRVISSLGPAMPCHIINPFS